MSCRVRAVEHRKCAAGLADAHPGLKDRILRNYTRIENAHKVRKKTFDFLFFIEVQQTFSFPFSLLRHYQMPECFCVYAQEVCVWNSGHPGLADRNKQRSKMHSSLEQRT